MHRLSELEAWIASRSGDFVYFEKLSRQRQIFAFSALEIFIDIAFVSDRVTSFSFGLNPTVGPMEHRSEERGNH